MVAALLVASLGGELITLETPAMQASAVIAALAEKTGRPFRVADELRDEVLFIKVKGVEMEALLERVAEVAYGKWEDRDGVSWLVRDPKPRAEFWAKVRADRIALIEESLKEMETRRVFTTADCGGMSEGEVEFRQKLEDKRLSSRRALAKLVRSAGVRQIAEMAAGSRLVFSDHPNRMQRGLNSDWGFFYRDVRRRFAEEEVDDGPGPVADYAGEFKDLAEEFLRLRKPFNGQPVKFLLTIEYEYRLERLERQITAPEVSVIAVDAEGFTASVESERLDGPEERRLVDGALNTELDLFAGLEDIPVDASKTLALKEEDLAVGRRVTAEGRERLVAGFTDPSRDALDVPAGTVLRRAAEAGDLQVVANLSDATASLNDALQMGQFPALNLKAILTLCAALVCPVEVKDGWLLLQPSLNVDEENEQLDRDSLRSYVRAMGDRPASLDSTAKFMFANPNAEPNKLYQLLQKLTPGVDFWLTGNDPQMLVLWGSLSDGQRQALRAGRSIRLGDLSAEARDLLASLIFGRRLNLRVTPPEKIQQYDAASRAIFIEHFFGDAFFNSPTEEPTEQLPEGLPLDGILTAEAWSEPCFFAPAPPDDPVGFTTTSATSLLLIAAAGDDDFQQETGRMFKAGTRTTLRLNLQFNARWFASAKIQDTQFAADAKEMRLGNLTPEVRAEVDAVRQRTAGFSVLQGFVRMLYDSSPGDFGKPPP